MLAGNNLRVSLSLEDECITPEASPLWIGEISAGVEVDQIEHVEQCPSDADDKRRRHHHIDSIKELPKRRNLGAKETRTRFITHHQP